MESAFAWIGQLMEWLGRWIPQIVLVRATHGGVRFIKSRSKEMKPGLHIYWPITTEVVIFPVVRQTNNLAVQMMMTKDGKQVAVGAVVIYSITNIVDALSKNWDIDDTINDIAQMAVMSVVTSWDLQNLQEKVATEVEHELTKATRKNLRAYGVDVHRCGLTDFSTSRVLRLFNDSFLPK